MSENQEEEDYIDEEAEYSPKSEFSKPKIVYEAMQKCINSRGDEMKAGYYNTKLSSEGIPTRTWIRDGRQVYIGTVIALKGLLNPEINFNEKYKGTFNELNKKLKDIYKKYVYTEKIRKNLNGRAAWTNTDREYIPEIDEKVIIANVHKPSQAIELLGGWNSFVNSYWNDSVKVYDEIFASLNDLINSLNYFKQKISY